MELPASRSGCRKPVTDAVPVRDLSRMTLLAATTLLVGGCASLSDEGNMEGFIESWANADYVGAGKSFGDVDVSVASGDDIEGLPLFDLLHVAESARLSGHPELAVKAYDATESEFKRFDLENIASSATSQASAVLLNDNAMAYRGYLYEAVLANTYKGLTFLEMGMPSQAGVEFRRSEARTRRATEYFSKSIEKQRKALKEKTENEKSNQAAEKSINSDETQATIESEYGAPSEWSVYADFVNPFTSYIHGIHQISTANTSSDFEQAVDLFKRVHGVTSNATVGDDLDLAQSFAAGSTAASDYPSQVWVVYDNGVGPELDEERIDLPILGIGDGSVAYAGIALPVIGKGTPASTMTVNGETAQPLASMERVMNTEFQARFDAILLRSVTSAVVKMSAQALAEEELGAMGGLLAGVVSAATTQADVRSWRALPERWDIARVERPGDGLIKLRGLERTATTVRVPNWPMAMVYVKKTSARAPATIRVIDPSGESTITPVGTKVAQGETQ